MRWLFTFGCGSPLAKHCVILEAADEFKARLTMNAMFSSHWAGCYPEEKIDGMVAEYGLKPLDHNLRSCSVRLGTNREEIPHEQYMLVFGGPA